MKKETICVKCPEGCLLSIEEQAESIVISGNNCEFGELYGIEEIRDPKRFVSSTVALASGCAHHLRLPVATSRPIPKRLIFDVMEEIHRVTIIDLPVRENQIIVENICNSGADLIATRNIEKN